MDRLGELWNTLKGVFSPPKKTSIIQSDVDLAKRCKQLEERLRWCDEQLRSRSELLYSLQQHYSSEHFELHESMRNLKIERMRNAGAFGDREIMRGKYRDLQARIRELKERLRRYESVEDEYFDDAEIVRDVGNEQ